MKKIVKERNQRGFTVVEGAVIVLVVAVLAAGGWWVWQKNRTKVTDAAANNGSSGSQNEQKTDTTKSPGSSATFMSEAGGFSFTYPEGWKVVDKAPTSDDPDEYIYISPASNVATSNVNNFLVTLIVSNNPDVRIGELADGTTESLSNGLRLWSTTSGSATRSVSEGTVVCPELAIVSDDGKHFSHPVPNGKNLALIAGYCNGERLTTTLSYQEQINSTAWRELINTLSSITFK